MCLAQRQQRSDASEARTRDTSVLSQALYHWATAPLQQNLGRWSGTSKLHLSLHLLISTTVWPILSIKEYKDQESMQSSTTSDPRIQWESENFTIRHHKREPRGQLFPSRWPQGVNKQTRARKHNKKNSINDPRRKHRLGTVSKEKILLLWLNIVALILCGSFMFAPCFVMQYLVSFLALQSSCYERKDWFLYFNFVFLLSYSY